MRQKEKTITYIGSKLFPWQKDVAKEICDQRMNGKVCCVKAHRQCGKSYLCEQILLHYAINYNKSISAMVSPTLNQSRKIFKEITNAIYESGILKKKNEALLEIELINGSSIFFKSLEQGDGLRGYHCSGILILDEGAYLNDNIAELVLPWRQAKNCPMLIVSTPRLKQGIFYNYYLQGLEGGHNVVTIDWSKYDTSALLSEEQKEAYRKVLTKNQFRSEVLGEFLDTDGMVFTNIENCIGTPRDVYSRAYVGIDFGTGKGEDYTSISMFNEYGEMIFIDYFNDLGTFAQVERLTNDIIKFKDKIEAIQAENNSIGNPLTDLLKEELKKRNEIGLINKITPFVTTNESKSKIVSQVVVGLEQNTIKLLDDNILTTQLSAYEATYNIKTGKVSYNGAQGFNDDNVISCMIAYDTYKKRESSGTYSLGFYRKR